MWMNDNLAAIVNFFTTPSLNHALIMWLLLSLMFGLIKANLGMKQGGAPIAYWGWWFEQPTGKKTFIDSNGERIQAYYNQDGDLVNPNT